MPEDKPDIGKILCSWGQVLLRGKEWRDDEVIITGGVMTWILYQAEDDDSPIQSVEAWIPFQIRSEIPHTHRDGTIRVVPLLRSVDARTTSARKMLARVTVAVLVEAYMQGDVLVSQPSELPPDVNLLVQTYPVTLPRENGEKSFEMDEELILPDSCEKPEQIVRFSLQPEIMDQKVLSGKVVFRGFGILHVLYRSIDGNLCTWNFEIPFSRYADLDDVYEQEAQAVVIPVVTGLELDLAEESKFLLKAALTGQYMIYDRSEVEIAQDAYSNLRQVENSVQELNLPVLLDRKVTSVTAEFPPVEERMHIVDFAFYPDQPQLQRNGETAKYALTGQFHVLLCDERQKLQGSIHRWNGSYELKASSQVSLQSVLQPSGISHQPTVSNEAISGELTLTMESMVVEGLPMLCGVELGQEQLPDHNRPSLILRRTREDSLWDIAKKCGSTVDAIRLANHLDSEPDPEKMLLIPVL